jgi:hypothetical protein
MTYFIVQQKTKKNIFIIKVENLKICHLSADLSSSLLHLCPRFDTENSSSLPAEENTIIMMNTVLNTKFFIIEQHSRSFEMVGHRRMLRFKSLKFIFELLVFFYKLVLLIRKAET